MNQHSDKTKNFIRGGQIFLHNFRMFNQIASRVLLLVLLGACVWLGLWVYVQTTAYERYIIGQWFWAHVYLFFNGQGSTQHIVQPDGASATVYSRQLLSSPLMMNYFNKMLSIVVSGVVGAVVIVTIGLIGVSRYLKHKGKKQADSQHIKGDYLGSPELLKNLIKLNEQGPHLTVSKNRVPIPSYSTKQHFLFHGTTGSGKSTGIKEFLDQLREGDDPVFIYDKGCVFTELYYDSSKDKILNCLDNRTVEWDLWRECRDKTDFEAFATAQIPMPVSTQDPFWINAARTIFAAAANRIRKDVEKPRLLLLLKYLLTAELGEIKSLLRGTEAESLMSEKIEKTAISIKSVLATYLKSLCFVKEGDNPFSIREWVEACPPKQWLFLSSRGDKHETLKPLITAWIDIAINTLLSLPESDHRCLWFILDEFTSLHQLPKITDGLSEGRKFGGIFVIGIQNIAKLYDVYGANGAKNISSLLNTRFMFRQPDPDMAAWSAKNLGETVLEEANESISYGANTMRDGVSINRVERTKPVITPSEIMNLADLHCYLRLPGNYPITCLEFSYENRTKQVPPFVKRHRVHDDLRDEVENLMDEIQKSDSANKNESTNKRGSEREAENTQSKKEDNPKEKRKIKTRTKLKSDENLLTF